MGRKSLLASTTKKKATGKKKAASKKSVKAAAAKKTAKEKQTDVKNKAATTKKTAVKATTAAAKVKKTAGKAKPKTTAKVTKTAAAKKKAKTTVKKKAPAKKKAPSAPKKKVTLKDLLFKEFVFGTGKKKAANPVKVKKKAVKIPDAPPFVSGYGKKETDGIRALLFKTFDLKAAKPAGKKPAAKKPSKAKPAAKKKKVTLKDLIYREFAVGAAATPVTIEKIVAEMPEAPPFISGYGRKETEKIRALLFKAFDLKAEAPAGIAETAAPKPAPTPPSPKVSSHEPASSCVSAGTEQTSKALRMGFCALALLVAIIAAASFSNRSKFYLKEVDSGLEVWRGKFAPAGTELVYTLDGVTAPAPLRDSYSKKEISPILFGYFLDKADTVLNVPAGPDIPEMKAHLRQAAAFAPSAALQSQVQRRLKGVAFIVAFHKADVALSKGTLPDLRVAKSSLASAYASASTDSQRELVAKTQTVVDEAMAALKTK
jgi:hypothetical protein